MTRTSGYRQLACPNCLRVYITPSYSSINMMSRERWSDGRKVGSLFDSGGGIRACECGKYYLMKNAIDMGLMVEPHSVEVWDDTGEETDFDISVLLLRQADSGRTLKEIFAASSFIKRIMAWFTAAAAKLSAAPMASTGAPTVVAAPRKKRMVIRNRPKSYKDCEHIPRIKWVSDDAMLNIIDAPDVYDAEMILIARERYWPYLNDYYREPFKAYCKNRSLPVPEFILGKEQRINLLAILAGLEASEKPDWVTIGEVLRELSRFDEAMVCFEKAMLEPHRKNDLEKLTRATRAKIAGPISI